MHSNTKISLASSLCFLLVLVASSRADPQTERVMVTSPSATSPAGSLEDPSNSATSESNEDDTLCHRCNDKVESAQIMIALHEEMMLKEKELIRQKHREASLTLPQLTSSTQRKPKSSRSSADSTRSPNNSSTRNIRNTTTPSNVPDADNSNNKPIVVSRLRVARSPDEGRSSFNAPSKNNKDFVLKQLRHKQEQQFNKTCRVVYEVQQCLSDISRPCLGNLQFHSLEVFVRQWLNKLNCRPIHNPSFFPYAGLIRSIPYLERKDKVPVPRRISSQEETRKRLDSMLTGRSSPFGVMLKPTLNGSASQKFNSMEGQQQQQTDGSAVDAVGFGRPRGRVMSKANDEAQSLSLQVAPLAGQFLLISCFLALLVTLITLMNRHLRQALKA